MSSSPFAAAIVDMTSSCSTSLASADSSFSLFSSSPHQSVSSLVVEPSSSLPRRILAELLTEQSTKNDEKCAPSPSTPQLDSSSTSASTTYVSFVARPRSNSFNYTGDTSLFAARPRANSFNYNGDTPQSVARPRASSFNYAGDKSQPITRGRANSFNHNDDITQAGARPRASSFNYPGDTSQIIPRPRAKSFNYAGESAAALARRNRRSSVAEVDLSIEFHVVGRSSSGPVQASAPMTSPPRSRNGSVAPSYSVNSSKTLWESRQASTFAGSASSRGGSTTAGSPEQALKTVVPSQPAPIPEPTPTSKGPLAFWKNFFRYHPQLKSKVPLAPPPKPARTPSDLQETLEDYLDPNRPGVTILVDRDQLAGSASSKRQKQTQPRKR
ncbi:hypothetical protein HDU96_007864 [Phlyctochytrium bullatum]|nr:hypothetical protein HDU96_007864 [Phlyctochytrium bullatum]